jgi:hypothetical protein
VSQEGRATGFITRGTARPVGAGDLLTQGRREAAPDAGQQRRADGFDWSDAAIGAAAALGLGLLVAGGAVSALRRAHAPAYS